MELIIIYYNFHVHYKHTNHQLSSNKRENYFYSVFIIMINEETMNI